MMTIIAVMVLVIALKAFQNERRKRNEQEREREQCGWWSRNGYDDNDDDVSFIILILNELINVNHILFYTLYENVQFSGSKIAEAT